MLATLLRRHPSLRAIDRETVWAKHPGVYDRTRGTKVVPAVHDNSVYMNPIKNAYGNKMLADGRTIEFRPSSNDLVNGKLDLLVGKEVNFYAMVDPNVYRAGKVVVEKPAMADGVFHLRMVTPPLRVAASVPLPRQPLQKPPTSSTAAAATAWADME